MAFGGFSMGELCAALGLSERRCDFSHFRMAVFSDKALKEEVR